MSSNLETHGNIHKTSLFSNRALIIYNSIPTPRPQFLPFLLNDLQLIFCQVGKCGKELGPRGATFLQEYKKIIYFLICTVVLIEDWNLAQMRIECFGKVVKHDAQKKLQERPVDATRLVVPRDLMDLGDESVVILVQDGPDHGANGVHYPHTVLLKIRVCLHVAKVLCLHTGVGGKEAENKTFVTF